LCFSDLYSLWIPGFDAKIQLDQAPGAFEPVQAVPGMLDERLVAQLEDLVGGQSAASW